MKKILIVMTNTMKYENYNRATGLWLGELVHFYDVINENGYESDFVSPLGGYIPIDPHSLKYTNEIDWKWYTNMNFNNIALSNTKKPEEVNAKDYLAIYFTGGHGVVWDLDKNKTLKSIAEEIYENNGYVTSVCHGAVGLLELRDKNNEYLIKDKKITGFSNLEEKLNRTSSKVPYSTEDELIKRGCEYKSKKPFTEYAIQDGRIITGQNPQSPKLVCELLVKALKENK